MKIIEYVKETRQELNHVSWPTRSQAIAFTIVVIVLSVLIGLLLGFFDFLYALIIEKFVI